MRAVLLLLALAIGAGAVVIRHLPENEAQAEPTRAVRPQEIQSVSLDGRDLPVAALRDAMATKAGQLVDLARLARDREVLQQLLVERGHLAAKVAEPRLTFGAGGAAYVTFAIEQGPQFRIRNVTVMGAPAEDAGVVTLGTGEVADGHRISLARQALEARLQVRGTQSVVTAKLVPDVAAGLVDIVLSAAN